MLTIHIHAQTLSQSRSLTFTLLPSIISYWRPTNHTNTNTPNTIPEHYPPILCFKHIHSFSQYIPSRQSNTSVKSSVESVLRTFPHSLNAFSLMKYPSHHCYELSHIISYWSLHISGPANHTRALVSSLNVLFTY